MLMKDAPPNAAGGTLNEVLRRMAQMGSTNITQNQGIIKVKRKSQMVHQDIHQYGGNGGPNNYLQNQRTGNATALIGKDAIKFQDQKQLLNNRPQTQQEGLSQQIGSAPIQAFAEHSQQRQLLRQITNKKRGQSKAPVQHRRRRREEPVDSEEADEIESSTSSQKSGLVKRGGQSNDQDDGPSPAEQYGLVLRKENSGNSGVRVSPNLERYKNIARLVKQGTVAPGSHSPIKEFSNSKIKLKESTDSLPNGSFSKPKKGIFNNPLDSANSPQTKKGPGSNIRILQSKNGSVEITRASNSNYNSGVNTKLLQLQGYNSNITIQEQQETVSQPKQHPKIPSLKGKINQNIIGTTKIQPTSKTDAQALTGVTGLTTIDGEKQITPEATEGMGYVANNYIGGAQQSVSGFYPLYTCQTGGTGAGGYYDICHYHMNERDLASVVDYRRKTGEEDQQQTLVETQSFAHFNIQAPYMFLDHSQIANYRNTNENRFIFATVEELDRAVSERNQSFIHAAVNNTLAVTNQLKQKGGSNALFSEWKQEMERKVQKIHSINK